MGDLRAKVAYLEGLAEGLGMEEQSREGRLMAHMIDVMGELAGAVEDLGEAQVDLADYVHEVEGDLNEALDYEDEDSLEDDEGEEIMLCCPDCGSEMGFTVGDADVEVCGHSHVE